MPKVLKSPGFYSGKLQVISKLPAPWIQKTPSAQKFQVLRNVPGMVGYFSEGLLETV